MFPAKTQTLTNTPPGEGYTPRNPAFRRVGENNNHEKITIYLEGDVEKEVDYETLRGRPQNIRDVKSCNKTQVNIIRKTNNKFKYITAGLVISNVLSLALSNDRIFQNIFLIFCFAIFATTLLISLKNTNKESRINSVPHLAKLTHKRKLTEKEEHKKKTALAMLRQLEI